MYRRVKKTNGIQYVACKEGLKKKKRKTTDTPPTDSSSPDKVPCPATGHFHLREGEHAAPTLLRSHNHPPPSAYGRMLDPVVRAETVQQVIAGATNQRIVC